MRRQYSTQPATNGQLSDDAIWDCVVVGAGPAGLSAALILGRAGRRTLLFDSGEKRNEASLIQHAILGADGFRRAEFLDGARQQVAAYPTVVLKRDLAVCNVHVKAKESERVCKEGEAPDCCCSVLADGRRVTETEAFVVHTEDGRKWRSKKCILATGVRDLIPDVPGFDTYWGRGVWVCLYCDAWEYRGLSLGAYGNGERGVHIALEMLLWSREVTLFTDGEALDATDHERKLLETHDVLVIETPIARAVGDGPGQLAGLVLANGCYVPLKALFFNTGRMQTSLLPEKMGLPTDPRGDILCEAKGNVAAIDGLYVAGNCAAAPLKLVMTAASQGAITGAKVNSELMYDELGLSDDEGRRYICSLEGSRTSAAACGKVYHQNGGGREHKPRPIVGAEFEDGAEERRGDEQSESTKQRLGSEQRAEGVGGAQPCNQSPF